MIRGTSILQMKKTVVLLVCFFLLCGFLFGQAAGFRITVQENGGNLTIIGSQGSVKELVIPETINDMPVTVIGEGAFTGKGLTMVSIPDTVVEIGEGAFSNNALTTLVIGNSVETIGQSAFANNRISNLTIGESVSSIGMGAFRKNRLETVNIPDSVTSIGPYAFFYNRLTDITIPDNVTTIGEGAFSTNRIYNVSIGQSVNEIGDGAFFDNRITTITIPGGITSLGDRVFEGRLTQRGSAPPIDYLNERGELLLTTANNFDAYFSSTGRRAGRYAFSRDGWAFEE